MKKLKLKTEHEDEIGINDIDLSRHIVMLTKGTAKYVLCENKELNKGRPYSDCSYFFVLVNESTAFCGIGVIIHAYDIKSAISLAQGYGTLDIYEL